MAVVLVSADPAWASRFDAIAEMVTSSVPSFARVDHIGSTSVPGLAAKNVIDVQVTIVNLADADSWPDRIGPFVRRQNRADHVPPGEVEGPDWEKRYWSAGPGGHLHVREVGRRNQRYALLFRDYLRATPAAATAYERAKRALASAFESTADYAEAKDPLCDLVIQAAERWAEASGWTVDTGR